MKYDNFNLNKINYHFLVSTLISFSHKHIMYYYVIEKVKPYLFFLMQIKAIVHFLNNYIDFFLILSHFNVKYIHFLE